ncbi:MAG: VOC family protein [Saprospiraceae bacterium]|nr:VOC family protein [Saprospiraceae bacterium]
MDLTLKIKPKYITLFIAFMIAYGSASGQSAKQVESVSLTVSDLNAAVNFYSKVLHFEKVNEYVMKGEAAQKLFGLTGENMAVKVARMSIGNEVVELMEFSGSAPGDKIPADSRSNDLWFQHIAIVVDDMDLAYKIVREARVAHVSTSPQTLPEYIPAAAGISAFYFRDPDGHNLELIYFPAGKGNPKWHNIPKNTPSHFLGIDHTAIGIEETEDSYLFWRDILQLKVGGHSENYGPEQEHLNQVFGARLYITGMQAENGFGVEFLDYIAPPGGRPYPAGSDPTDLWHWHTTIRVQGLEELAEKLLAGGFDFISHGMVQLNDGTSVIMVRDPDGHAVLLME